MTGWTVHEIAPDLRVCAVRPMPQLAPALEAEIDRLWEAAQMRTGGRLFNGRVFSADVITPRLICGHWSEYRRVVAQMARHDLFGLLGIRSLAVGGVLVSADGVVFARRPESAVYQAGEWQLPPAGTVDHAAGRPAGLVDVHATLFAELAEEVGLDPADIASVRPLCIVEHADAGIGSHVLDLGFRLDTPLDAAAIRGRHAARGNDEYAALTLIPTAGLLAFLAGAGRTNGQVPILLARAGLLDETLQPEPATV